MKTTLARFGLDSLNTVLARMNLKLDTLTADRQEEKRLLSAAAGQSFTQAVYPVPEQFRSAAFQAILAELPKYRSRFDTFQAAAHNDVGYQFDNGFYSSPDTEVLYTLVRTTKPRRVLEIGCGHSTKIIRQAIRDGKFACHHTCIDPSPRQDVSQLADAVVRKPIETLNATELAGSIGAGDLLFIDTSHEVKPANDVAFLFGCLLPQTPAGVLVHIHDIFLPYEYPEHWVLDLGLSYGEQYLVHTMLIASRGWEVVWPGHYLQRTCGDFEKHLPFSKGRKALSLWLRKVI